MGTPRPAGRRAAISANLPIRIEMMASTERSRALSRDRIVDAARALFYDQGYGAPMDAVANAAGVAKPTVYAHFASKEELIAAVLERVDDEWFDQLQEVLRERTGDPLGQLAAPFELLVAGLPDPAYHGCLLVNTAAVFCDPHHPAPHALAAHHARMREMFETAAREAGATDPAALSRQLLLLYDGVKTLGLVDNSGDGAKDARAAVSALLAAL